MWNKLLLLLTLTLVACGNRAENPLGNGQESGERYQYRFSNNGCDTRTRIAHSKAELCENLSFGEQNNYCGENERRDLFQRQCGGAEWNPRFAGYSEYFSPSYRCELWESGKYRVLQSSHRDRLELKNERFTAKVQRSGESYKAQILDFDGRLVAEDDFFLTSFAPSFSLIVSGYAILDCSRNTLF